MANLTEIRVEQRKWLFRLLQLRKNYQADDGKPVDGVIIALEAEMEAEDVAYVKEKFSQLP